MIIMTLLSIICDSGLFEVGLLLGLIEHNISYEEGEPRLWNRNKTSIKLLYRWQDVLMA